VACGTCGGTAACVNKTLGPCSKTAQNYWQDSDGDGYGNPFLSPTQNCNPTPGWVTRAGDCNDSDAAVYPGTTRCETSDANALTTCGSDGNFVRWWPVQILFNSWNSRDCNLRHSPVFNLAGVFIHRAPHEGSYLWNYRGELVLNVRRAYRLFGRTGLL
jgi:hypothetical protein